MIELEGDVLSVFYKNNAWKAEVEIKQRIADNGFHTLGTICVHISSEQAMSLTTGDRHVKITVDV